MRFLVLSLSFDTIVTEQRFHLPPFSPSSHSAIQVALCCLSHQHLALHQVPPPSFSSHPLAFAPRRLPSHLSHYFSSQHYGRDLPLDHPHDLHALLDHDHDRDRARVHPCLPDHRLVTGSEPTSPLPVPAQFGTPFLRILCWRCESDSSKQSGNRDEAGEQTFWKSPTDFM